MVSIYKKARQKIDRKLRLHALKGNNVHCFCCNQNFVTFLPGGVTAKRPNALCPQCGSLERHRLIWQYMKTETDLFDKKVKLLHVAPEQLFYRIFASQVNIDYIPCAKFGEGYTDKYPAGTQNIDITAIDYPDNSFDVIVCSHVLEHIPDDQKAMQELYRVLKPNGWAVLQVPLDTKRDVTYEDFSITDSKAREKAFGQYDHVRVYGNDYADRLAKAGFQVKKDRFAFQFSEEDRFKYGIIPEDIFYCTKK